MTEQELRALVRDAIAKSGIGPGGRSAAAVPGAADAPPYKVSGHSSHAMFMLPPGDPEGSCVIEPGVQCNHCGYCKSYGH
jgi:hypothetical protein